MSLLPIFIYTMTVKKNTKISVFRIDILMQPSLSYIYSLLKFKSLEKSGTYYIYIKKQTQELCRCSPIYIYAETVQCFYQPTWIQLELKRTCPKKNPHIIVLWGQWWRWLLSCGAGQEQSFQAFGERHSTQQNQSGGNMVYCMADGMQQNQSGGNMVYCMADGMQQRTAYK